MIDFITGAFDIFFYGLTILVILYWLFTTSKEEKFRDVRNQVKKINNMIDEVEKITKQQEANSSKKSEEKSSKEDESKANEENIKQ